MIFVLDNYDSFTYNLVQYLGELGADVQIVRNDEISPDEVLALKPEAIVLSPGPGRPENAGILQDLIVAAAGTVPMLGVCLGHQAMAQVYGGKIGYAPKLMHGKTSEIEHDGSSLFRGIDSPFTATRYHSLIVERPSLPDVFDITAWTDDGVIMGISHRECLMFGLQFHPESILTECGKDLLRNFLEILHT
jgi:anthranilate synthase component 2